MAKHHIPNVTFPLTPKTIKNAAAKLARHADSLEMQLQETKRLLTAVRAACPHVPGLRGIDAYNGSYMNECPVCGHHE